MNDIWSYLKHTKKPIIIYGMGNGADKILAAFDRFGIKADGIFCSDAFVRAGKTFHDMPVRSFADTKKLYGDFVTVLSFASSLPEVIDTIKNVAAQSELYAPAVPVYGDTLFTREYSEQNRASLTLARSLLCDRISQDVFDSIIDFRLSGNINCLLNCQSSPDEVNSNILSLDSYKTYIDLGAYTGDTVTEMASLAVNLKKIYAFEPDKKNFKRLTNCCAALPFDIECLNYGAWDKCEDVYFNTGAGRGAGASNTAKSEPVRFVTVDSIIKDEKIDYVKLDVEGAEQNALIGAKNTIQKSQSDLLVSLYHRTEDIFKLVLQVHDMLPQHLLYLRRFRYIPDWDINLYAVSRR